MRVSVIVVLIALGFVVPSLAQTAPPRPLHLVGDHWTPYDPPQAPPEGMEFYIIQPGDTLWDLARKNLGDPYLWPQIWEQNKYITDAHWIYPGDPLLIAKVVEPAAVAGEEAPSQEEAQAPEVPAAPEGDGLPVAKPTALGSESDIYCYCLVKPKDEVLPLTVTGTDESARYNLSEGQIVYVNGGTAQNVNAGDEYFIVRDMGLLKGCRGEKVLGRRWEYTGRLIILCAQENTSTAKVMGACQEILRGDRLMPFVSVPIPARALPPFMPLCPAEAKDPVGCIVHVKLDLISIGQGEVVTVDLGSSNGVKEGDLLRVYRSGETEGTPRIVLGRLGVLTVQEGTATARVLESVYEMHPGDWVEFE